MTGADSGFEKGGGAGGSGASFWAYLGQFRGLFKEFHAKTGGRAPPAPPPPLWIRAWMKMVYECVENEDFSHTLCQYNNIIQLALDGHIYLGLDRD